MKKEVIAKILQENRRGYNRIAEKFSQTRKYPWQEFNLFNQYLKPGEKILDAGCGNGRLYGFLKNKNIEYIGLDNSEKLIKNAKRQYPEGNFRVGDIITLPFSDNQFNVVFCLAALHHIPGQELRRQAISEFSRVLKPGSYLLMTNWNLWNVNWWPTLLKFSWKKLIGQSELDWKDVQKPWKNNLGQVETYRFLHAFTKRELKTLLQKNGWQVINQFYTKKEQKTSWLKGYNLITTAAKS